MIKRLTNISLAVVLLSSVCTPLFGTTFNYATNDGSTAALTATSTNNPIMYTRISNPNGGGQADETVSGMTFTPINDNDAEVTRALLYLTTSTTFSTGTMLGTPDSNLSDGISFTFSQSITKGNTLYYFWLAYDLSSATTCNEFWASQTSSDITTAATTGTYTDGTSAARLVGPGPGCWTYCTATGSSNVWGNVNQVSFNTLDNTSGSNGGYLDGTASSTTVYRGDTYSLDIFTQDLFAGGPTIYTAAWIDFNNDGDFSDTGEQVAANVTNSSTATGIYQRTVSVTIPTGATLGTTKLRVIGSDAAPASTGCGTYTYSEVEDYSVVIDSPYNMGFVSMTTTQLDSSAINAGVFDQQILGLQIEMDNGVLNPISLDSIVLSTTGSNAPTTDIQNAKFWSSGQNPSFAMTNQIGSTLASVNGTFYFTDSYTLSSGTNYFWLTYDVPATAVGGNSVDASVSFVNLDALRIPTITDPGSGRLVIAATSMVYVSATTVQNTSPVPKNSIENHVIGIEVEMNGALSAMSLTSISLTENSTAVSTDVANAKIWSTGLSPVFATTSQFGSTTASPSSTYTITGSKTLLNGTNYFWLTYDTKSGATGGNSIDAHCTSITVGGNPETPTVTSPIGSRTIDNNTPYYSVGSLDAATLSSWNSERDGSGSAPGSFGTSFSFWVQDGHSMTTSAAVTIPYLFIEDGGYITASYLISMTDLRILSGGTFEQTKRATTAAYIANFYIENDATWIHNNNGYLPGNNRYFSPNSNQWFYQWGGGTFPSGTSWGNVLFEGSTVGNFDLRNVMNTIQGDWEWRKIGSGNYLWCGDTETLSVGGDLIFSGGWFKVAGDGAGIGAVPKNNTVTIDVAGDFIMTAGKLEDYFSGNSTAKTLMTIGGDVIISGGTLDFTTSSGGGSEIYLSGGTADVVWSQTGGTVDLANTFIKTGKTVTMTGSELGDIASGHTLDVESGGALYTEQFPVVGAGNIDIQSGSTLGLGSDNLSGALTSDAGKGNVQLTGTRTFDNNATYVYNGIENQKTGDQLPDTITAGLTMLNTKQDGTVTLTQDVRVEGTLSLTNGDLISDSTKRLTLADGFSCVPPRGSDSSFVSKWLDVEIDNTANTHIPIGSSPDDRRRPLTLKGNNTTLRTWTIEFIDEDPKIDLGNVYLATDCVETMNDYYYYDIINQSGDGAAVDIKIWYQDSDIGAWDESKLIIGHWVPGSSWWDAWNLDDITNDWTRNATLNFVQSGLVTPQGKVGLAGAGGTILAIELLEFNTRLEGNKVHIDWATASETDHDFFIIEKSKDGQSFVPIRKVGAKGSPGQGADYEAIDPNPYYGVSYYRLQIVDDFGQLEYSYYSTVHYNPDLRFEIIALAPQPIESTLRMVYELPSDGTFRIEVLDMLGRSLIKKSIEQSAGRHNDFIDMRQFASGAYFIKLDFEGQQVSRKIIKR